MRRADHATIFIAIAGTNTAVAGLAPGVGADPHPEPRVGGRRIGITVRQTWLDAPKWQSLCLTWSWGGAHWRAAPAAALARGPASGCWPRAAPSTRWAPSSTLAQAEPVPGVFGYHEVFHACTVIGATLHFVSIVFYALPGA